MMKTLKCKVIGHQKISLIEIHPNLLHHVHLIYEHVKNYGPRFAIITDQVVAKLCGFALETALSSCGLNVKLFSFPSGEKYKSRQTKELLEDALFKESYGKDSCILALGGGVVTDIAGYLAATYCRGVPLVMIPTTLLGMIDASIGGKNGINVPYGKNMIGTYYPPEKILIDPQLLKHLPKPELNNGLIEMLKHGLIADAKHFAYLENHLKHILAIDVAVLPKAIYDSILIKKKIVEEDEQDHGKRHILNFGHTIGHAIEVLSSYTIPHGEAVAIGCLVECHLSMQLGCLEEKCIDRLLNVFKTLGISLELPPSFAVDTLQKAMMLDKKSLQSKPRFVVLKDIGSVASFDNAYCIVVEEKLIKNSLEWMQKCFV